MDRVGRRWPPAPCALARADTDWHCPLHRTAANAHEARRISERKAAGSGVGRILAERVAGKKGNIAREIDPAVDADDAVVGEEGARALVAEPVLEVPELAGQDYSSNSYLNTTPAVAIAVFQRPGSNALATAQAIRDTMAEISKKFPPGIKYDIIYDPTYVSAVALGPG